MDVYICCHAIARTRAHSHAHSRTRTPLYKTARSVARERPLFRALSAGQARPALLLSGRELRGGAAPDRDAPPGLFRRKDLGAAHVHAFLTWKAQG
eukprot:4456626-Pleurochrysis_carterae.AAC.1